MSDKLNKLIIDRSNAIKSEDTSVTIKEYIHNIRNKYYPNLDISFMDFFMDMYDNNESISAELLSVYGILSIKPNRKTLQSTTILRLLKRCHLIENIDYSLRPQLGSQSRGLKYKNMYYITPRAFKICLISSENENKYRDYYLFLEECIHYYNIGQINSMKEENIILKEKLDVTNEELQYVEKEKDTLEDKLNKLIAKMDKQYEESKQQLNTMQGTLDKIVKKLDTCAHIPTNEELADRFVLMKKDNNVFYVIRSQERTIYNTVSKKEKTGYIKIPEIIESETIPNSIYLWNCIRDELVKENRITCKYNDIILNNISEFEFISMIKQVFDSRKVYNN